MYLFLYKILFLNFEKLHIYVVKSVSNSLKKGIIV